MQKNEDITERFQNLDCPEAEKKVLHDYLISCLAEGKSFSLKRNRVMIMEPDNKNKFLILDLVRTSDENKQVYNCPKCCPVNFSELLTSTVRAEEFKSCLHSQLCKLIWGDIFDPDVDVEDDDETDIVEVITEKPRYLAVVHTSSKSSKGPGIVTLTSKTLKPKCLVCSGQDRCVHLTIHFQQYKRELEHDTETEEINVKRLRMERIEPKKPQKKSLKNVDLFDPFQHDGHEANVFDIKIDFIQSKEMMSENREVFGDANPFKKDILIEKYDPEEMCYHGNKYDKDESILFVESATIIIHHTKDVETLSKIVLYRPSVLKSREPGCFCKKFYTGKDDKLLRVSPADNKMTGRSRTLHFVSYEFYFSYLGKLLIGGERMNSFIKSRKFMDEIFLGKEKSPEYRRVLQKGFEIFSHALTLPEDANYCYKCPQTLVAGEKEDDFKHGIEYSIIDGIQMGCRTNGLKTDIPEYFFNEEVVEGVVVKGIEAKERTFLNTRKVHSIISTLVSNPDDPNALATAVKSLNSFELDPNSRSVLELLNRLLSKKETVPAGYLPLLQELHLETPISALMTPYSSDRKVYESFMDYLNKKVDIFSSPRSLELFIHGFPILIDCMKKILMDENSSRMENLPYLPNDVSTILKNMIKLRFEFDKKSHKTAVARTSPHSDFVPPVADYFPSYPIHTMENIYKADKKPDEAESDDCEKNFISATSISGGIGTVSCNHKITKGFRGIKKGESPTLFCHSLLRRPPEKVKAHKRVVIYDCKMHKTCLRRYPYRIRRFQFVIDRHHQSNHKSCSQAYNISKYPDMSHVNTQIAEQLTNSLRKLSTIVAYSNFKTYLRIIHTR